METIDLCDEMKLGESCVFVDDSDLYAVSRRAQKLESYKVLLFAPFLFVANV